MDHTPLHKAKRDTQPIDTNHIGTNSHSPFLADGMNVVQNRREPFSNATCKAAPKAPYDDHMKISYSDKAYQDSLYVNWHLLDGLNHDCPYSYEPKSALNERFYREPLLETAFRLLSLNRPEYIFHFYGGEPTIHPYFSELVHYLATSGRNIHIILETNGIKKIQYYQDLLRGIAPEHLCVRFAVHLKYIDLEKLLTVAAYVVDQKQFCNVIINYVPEYDEKAHLFYDKLTVLQKALPICVEISYPMGGNAPWLSLYQKIQETQSPTYPYWTKLPHAKMTKDNDTKNHRLEDDGNRTVIFDVEESVSCVGVSAVQVETDGTCTMGLATHDEPFAAKLMKDVRLRDDLPPPRVFQNIDEGESWLHDFEQRSLAYKISGESLRHPLNTNVDEKELQNTSTTKDSVSNKVKKNIPPVPQKMRLQQFQGSLDVIQGDMLYGWLYSPVASTKPFVMAGSSPAVCLNDKIERPDLQSVLGVRDVFGFAVELPHLTGQENINLYAVTPTDITPVASRILETPVWEKRFLAQVARAKAIAETPGSVAVTCWDGAHNPIGRAMVLHSVVSSKRPCVIFCYLHNEFGGTLWPPLQNSNLPLVTIPWERREYCHAILLRSNVIFQTVWICKPRLPSFRLASLLSGPDTKLILDCDDDEQALTSRESLPTEYNLPGTGLVEELISYIPARTVVSPTLQKRYGGEIVRHVRSGQKQRKQSSGKNTEVPRKIGFFGTVREHKNILPITRAIQSVSKKLRIPLEFHVRGDIPPETQERLAREGAIVSGMLPMRDLPKALAELDAVITSFPTEDETAKDICHAQVSSKISDALACGIPVLTPDSPSIADIKTVPGVFPFTSETFDNTLQAALSYEAPIMLPEDFTANGAFKAFTKAEKKAEKADRVRALLPFETKQNETQKTLLLLWKQYDAGLYGRRVDQIARSYARKHPDHRVIILEFIDETQKRSGSTSALPYTGEAEIRTRLLEQKRFGMKKDGAIYQTIFFTGPIGLRDALLSFLEHYDLTPLNTICVLFPIIQDYLSIEDIVSMFPVIVDVVDNQISWSGSDERRLFINDQYFRLMATYQTILFNSSFNRDYFLQHGFLSEKNTVHVLPNWYRLPKEISISLKPHFETPLQIFYSGNMNDRIDWQLLQDLARLPQVRLHLAGTAERILSEFLSFIDQEHVVYHGVTSEEETLKILASMDMAIIPHVKNEVSAYMDPMKLKMYDAVGIPVLCPTNLIKDEKSSRLIPYADRSECLKLFRHNRLTQRLQRIYQIKDSDVSLSSKGREHEERYLQILQDISSQQNEKHF